MKRPKYLSPSSITTFLENPQEYYLHYMADNPPPRFKQTEPMSIGSAFDAYAKSYLVEKLFGKGVKPEFSFDAIFVAQVEEHNRDWARKHGKHVFDAYVSSGALADLIIELETALITPRFEFEVQHNVCHNTNIDGVPLLGKPDIFFVNKNKKHIIHDFKVNGYCGRTPTSPKPGYVMVRDGWTGQQSRSHRQKHKDCFPIMADGIAVNAAAFMETVDASWARQLAIYGWVLQEPVGGDFITWIDQIVGDTYNNGDFRPVRIATHRCRISMPFQVELFKTISKIWEAITTGHIFTDLSREENDERCKMLDDYGLAFKNDPTLTYMVRG